MKVQQVYPEALYKPSAHARYFFRGEQAAGEAENLVVGGDVASKAASFSDATLWATPGFMAVGGGANNYLTVPAATHDVSLVEHSLIVALRIQKAVAAHVASEQYLVNSYNPGSTTGGIIIGVRTDGSIRCYLNATDGTTFNVTSAAGVITDGSTANERTVVFAFPRESGVSAAVAVDGIQSNAVTASAIAGKSMAGSRAMRIGVPQGGGALDAYRIAGLSAYQVPKHLGALDLPQIYDWAFRHPGVPMPDWVFE